MAKVETEVSVKVAVDVKKAESEVNSLTEEVKKLKETLASTDKDSKEYSETLKKLSSAEEKLAKANDNLNDKLKENQKESKKAESSNKGLLDVIKGLGIVGAISAAFNVFKEALMKNQKIADTFSAVMTTIENVFSALVEVITNVVSKVNESSNGFQALGKVLGGVLNLVILPFKQAFNGIKLAILEGQYAWENSFFGDKDPKKLKDLNDKIAETKNTIVEVSKNAIQSGKDIYNNFGEAVKSVGDVVSGVVEGASKINVKAIYENSKSIIQLKNNAKIAQAELQGLVEKYDRQAESLRQIRDDETKSIEERIKANEDLGKVLEEQKNAMVALADKKIASAQAELNANKSNIDLQVALKEAYNERAGVLAQITGLESEQKVNAVALNKELIELNKARSQSDIQLALDKRKANAELIKDELAKALELQKIREEEKQSELARLQENIDNTKEGTQARLDAEIELKTKIQELQIEEDNANAEINRIRNQRALDTKNAQIENALSEYNLKKTLLDKEKIDAFEKFQRLIELGKEESKILLEQLYAKRDAEIKAAEQLGLSTIEIKQKYAIEEEKINNTILQSQAELSKAKSDLINQEITAVFGAVSAIGDIFSQSYKNQLDDLERSSQERIAAAGDNKDAVLAIEQETAIERNKIQNEEVKKQKIFAIAEALINTYQAAAQVFARPAPGTPVTSLAVKISSLIAAVATGIKNVSAIKKVKLPVGGAGGGGDAGESKITANAPLGPQATSTLMNQNQINQLSSATTRAFVLESDVSGNQERIQRLNRAARIN